MLEATALASGLRHSTWAYPLINAGHILGAALLVGAIVPLDLRLLGAWSSIPLSAVWRLLTRTAAAGLLLAVVCGMLLFITRATHYVNSALFLSKIALVVVGMANALALQVMMPGMGSIEHAMSVKIPWYVRSAAGLSLATWLSVLLLGRLIGYR